MTDQQGQATLHVTCRHSPLAWLLYMTRLTVEVDEAAQAGGWGERTIPLSPGAHEVKVHFKYFTKARCGEARTHFVAAEGATISLRYRAPRLMTSPGRIELTA